MQLTMYRKSSLALASLICCALAVTDIEVLSSKPTRCTYEHAFDMYGAHCAGLRLDKIPNLRGGIEILDFSDNKLHELNGLTLSSYTSIKFLYLTDNQIYEITEDALISLTSLQSLDLSKNVIFTLPNSLLQLPSLQKLYLNGNPLIHKSLNDLANNNRPIRAPLQLLDISNCKIRSLPDWDILPQLMVYNISHNPLVSMQPKHFAVMCNLAKVDITESIPELKLCDLKPAISWFQQKNIYFHLDDYSKLNSKEFESCSTPDIADSINATHHQCKSEYNKVGGRIVSRRTWLTIGGGLAGFLVGFMLLLYVMHRHNVAQTKRTEKIVTQPVMDGDKQASVILLNDVS